MRSMLHPEVFSTILLLSALTGLATAQTQSNAPVVVQAQGITPDAVATSLMPVPIFNFAVHNVAFSPDGQLLATGDGNGVVHLWETQTGKLRETIQAHTNWAFSVAWSRDGKLFVTGGGDDMVHLFDSGNPQKPIGTFRGHKGDVHAVVLTSDARQIASAGDDKLIIVWDARTGELLRKWPAHTKAIPTLALSPNGKILASGSRDNSIRLWNLSNGKLRDTIIGHSDNVMSVKFSPDGKLLASASYDQTVRLWDVESGKALRILQGYSFRVFGVAFSPDGKRLASAGDSTVRLWNVADGTELKAISLGGVIATSEGNVAENLSAVAFSPDGKTLAVSSTTGVTFLISTDSGAIIHKLAPPSK